MTPEQVKELFNELNMTWKSFQEIHAREAEEIKAHGSRLEETATILSKLNDRLDTLETKLARPITRANNDRVESEAKEAFFGFLRKGEITPEKKALILSDDQTGGFLAPLEFVNEMIRELVLVSPFRQVARVRQSNAAAVQMPKKTGQISAVWVSEVGSRSALSGTQFGLETIPNHEITATVDISMQDLEDSQFDLEGELRFEFAEQFAAAEGAAFISGNGVGKPEGVLTNTSVTWTDTAASNVYAGDDIIDLVFRLEEPYANNATFILRRSTIGVIRKLKSAVDGHYIWQPGLANVAPGTLMDRPYIGMPDMPATGVDNNKTIAFGDFKRGYVIVDRINMSVLRDPFTQAGSGMVRFVARKRVGGQVVLAEAIKGLSEKA